MKRKEVCAFSGCYFDNAATSFPKPRETVEAVRHYLCDVGGNPGRSAHFRAQEAARIAYDVRGRLAALCGSLPERVVFTMNTTYAINLAMKGILRPGDRLLLSDMEHNATLRPAIALSRQGIGLDFFAVDPLNSRRTLENAAAKITPRTKMIACLWCSNICPARLPIAEIGALCRARGILFLVDGAQAAGHFPTRMDDCSIDALCLPGHKGLYGPAGVGALLLSERYLAAAEGMPTLIEGGSGSLSELPEMPPDFPDRCEAGTLPMPAIAGLGGGLRFLEKNAPAVRAREQTLYAAARELLLRTPGVRLYLPELREGSTLLFGLEGKDPAEAGAAFSELGICLRDGLHCAPMAHRKLGSPGALRLSFGAFNTLNELDHFAWAVGRIGL